MVNWQPFLTLWRVVAIVNTLWKLITNVLVAWFNTLVAIDANTYHETFGF